jgi:hypothetical protein
MDGILEYIRSYRQAGSVYIMHGGCGFREIEGCPHVSYCKNYCDGLIKKYVRPGLTLFDLCSLPMADAPEYMCVSCLIPRHCETTGLCHYIPFCDLCGHCYHWTARLKEEAITKGLLMGALLPSELARAIVELMGALPQKLWVDRYEPV